MKTTPNTIQRIYTAIPLAGIAIAATFYANYISFILLDTLLMLLIGWEWSRLCGYPLLWRYGYMTILMLGSLSLSYLPVQWVGACSAFVAISLILQVIVLISGQQQVYYSSRFLASVGGVYLVLNWHALLFLKNFPYFLGIGLLTVILSDTLAYLVGRRWGTHRLPLIINPNKTWEGCVAGLIGPVILILTLANLINYPFYMSTQGSAVILLTSVTAVAGDLFESTVKRQRGLKDSGDGLPGHGGWLDRCDSLICAMPVFAASLLYLSNFLNF